MNHALRFRVICPHSLSYRLYAPNVGVWTFENVLQLRELPKWQRREHTGAVARI